MLSKKEDFILADNLVVYNDHAKIEDCEGILLAELLIYPTPRIIWNFKPIIEQSINFSQKNFVGNSLKVEKIKVKKFNLAGSGTGTASNVFLGNLDAPAHTFHFYLPNTKFQENEFQEIVEEGRFIEVPLNPIWSVKLEIGKDALQWLNQDEGNIGTRLTGIGKLYQPTRAESADDLLTSLPSLTITETQEMLKSLCCLLSYANGGFVAPIFIESEKSKVIKTNYQVTALEQLGTSWLTRLSNLKAFVGCFSSFEKMLVQPFWKDTFYFVLVQYFQAIRGGNWELAASATGAALERLSHAILVEDETEPTKKEDFEKLFSSDQRTRNLANQSLGSGAKVTETRLSLLLERIGLTTSRGFNDIQDVKDFLDVRNDAVHPKVSDTSQDKRWCLILQGIQWIDEVLLWRLGYDGKYLDRVTYAAMCYPVAGSTPITSSTLEITPRYDLSSRDPNW
jgi:hypothetical protein